MSADEAYLIIRGLRTLDTRLNTHYENTKEVINFLKGQKKVKPNIEMSDVFSLGMTFLRAIFLLEEKEI